MDKLTAKEAYNKLIVNVMTGQLVEENKQLMAIVERTVEIPATLEKYAKHLAKKYPQYHNWMLNGKNGADSDNEKGYWRGMADSCLAILNDWKRLGLIEHTGLYGDDWPEEYKQPIKIT